MPNYIGKICKKHPEMNGERHELSYKCVKCVANQNSRRRLGLKPLTTRLPTEEYEALVARIKELEERLYGVAQESES